LIDLPLSAWLHAHQIPVLTQLMLLISLWHSTSGVLLMSAVLGIALWRWHRPWWVLALLVAVPGGMLLNFGIKNLVHRARPHFDDPVMVLTSYSFPSGHTAGTTLFYGFIAALVFAQPGWQRWRAPAVVLCVAMVFLVGFSRIYLGMHYFTDVVGAILISTLWLGICLSGVQALWRREGAGAVHG
jgi:membrane-associated phospholipid phosphatase